LRRLLILSPFVGPEALEAFRAQVAQDMMLVGRFEELSKLDRGALENADEVEVFDDPAPVLDVDDGAADPAPSPDEAASVELSGLHAKVYVGERGKRAGVFVGSANATGQAFDGNVEFLVELEGSRQQHGIDAVRDALRSARLLTPFRPGEPIEPDKPGDALERQLERAAHELAMALRAKVDIASDGRWRPRLELSRPVSVGDIDVEARPLAEPTFRRVDLGASPVCAFAPTGRSSISAFYALRLAGRSSSGERHIEVTVRLPLDGAPDGRIEAVTAELLADRERLLRFILLLLSDDSNSDRMLDELEALLTENRSGMTGNGTPHTLGLPLLEPMLRALHRHPGRLEEIDRLLRDVRQAGGETADLLPPDLEGLWATINELREARA
jgi:hypothetical protein